MNRDWSSRELPQAARQDRKIERQTDDSRWVEQSNAALLAAALYSDPFAVGDFRIDGVQRPVRAKPRATAWATRPQAPFNAPR